MHERREKKKLVNEMPKGVPIPTQRVGTRTDSQPAGIRLEGNVRPLARCVLLPTLD